MTESMDFPKGLYGRIDAPDRMDPTSMAGALVIVDSFREERDKALAEVANLKRVCASWALMHQAVRESREEWTVRAEAAYARIHALESQLAAAQAAQYTAQAQASHR